MTTFTGTIPTIASGDTATVPTNLATYRDALKAVSEAWTGWTPTWTASSSSPAIGDGIIGGAYLRVEKWVMFRATIIMGGSTTYGSGGWRLSLPVAPKTDIRWRFLAEALNAGTAQYTCAGVYDGTSGSVAALFLAGNPDSAITSSAPFSWGTGDTLSMQGYYEAA